MENQHRKIEGYRELSQAEIDLMNLIKDLASKCGACVDMLESMRTAADVLEHERPDPKWLSIGEAQLQQGFMALTRSVAKPTTF